MSAADEPLDWDATGSAAEDPVDPTIYPVEDEVGEHEIQTYILELLRPLIARYLRERGIEAHTGSDQFIYWRQHDPRACVAPDIYILPGVPQNIAISTWKVWEHGVTPDFCLEVVGSRPNKDYADSPRRHAELGVDELIVFDPARRRPRKSGSRSSKRSSRSVGKHFLGGYAVLRLPWHFL